MYSAKLIFVLILSFFNFGVNGQYIDEDAGLSITELIQKYNYPVETHTVYTQDNYILTTHRIPHGRNDIPGGVRKVVFLMHGLFGSSADWVLEGPEKCLAFNLADAGYDVWLGNSRGNRYSRAHRYLDPFFQAQQFFDFSFHDVGINDLPANIDYILAKTGQAQLIYVGFSQGGSCYFAMASEKSSYISKIKGAVFMAPGTFLTNSEAPAIIAISNSYAALEAASLLTPEAVPFNEALSNTLIEFCGTSITNHLCASAIFALVGFDFAQIEPTTVSMFLTFTPAGGSMKQLKHFAQLKGSDKFQQYDYGLVENQLRYGLLQFTPPSYNVKKNTAPTVIYYGLNDWVLVPKDIQRLANMLPNLVALKPVNFPNWTHGDFIFGKDVYTLVNQHVVNDVIAFG